MYNFEDAFLLTPSPLVKEKLQFILQSGFYYKKPGFIIESGFNFKSIAGYNGARTVYDLPPVDLHCFFKYPLELKKKKFS